MNQAFFSISKTKAFLLMEFLFKTNPSLANQHYKSAYASYFLLPVIFCFVFASAFSQADRYFIPAYTLSQIPDEDVLLHQMNSNTNEWKVLGKTGRTGIRSLAIDSKNQKVYAVDGGTLGTLNQSNGKFTPIGNIGVGVGDNGIISMNNIYALAYDDKRDILYASQRRNSFDVILKINPRDGKIIKNGMVNEAGKSADYKVIEIKTFFFAQIHTSYNFVDLAYDSKSEILYIAHNYYGIYHGINGFLNIDKQIARDEYRRSPINKLAGIAFDLNGQIYGSFSDNKISTAKDLSESSGPLDDFFGDLDNIDFDIDKKAVFYGLDFFKSSVQTCAYDENIINSFSLNSPLIAIKTITSKSVIYRDIVFIAGESVLLNNNFEVKKSADFEIRIENPCD